MKINDELKKSSLFVGSVAKVFEILEVFDTKTPSLSLTEITNRTGMNTSATQRHLYTLEVLGYLEKNSDSKRYSLTLKTLFPASSFLSQSVLINAAYPHIVQLRQQIDARIGLSLRYENRIVYLIPLRNNKEAYQTDYPGFSVSIYSTTSGRMLLSYETEAESRRVISECDIQALTPFTKTNVEDIMEEIRICRQQGYCITDQEYRIGDHNIGVPILDVEGKPVACIVAVGQSPNWSTERLLIEAKPLLQQAAERINVR